MLWGQAVTEAGRPGEARYISLRHGAVQGGGGEAPRDVAAASWGQGVPARPSPNHGPTAAPRACTRKQAGASGLIRQLGAHRCCGPAPGKGVAEDVSLLWQRPPGVPTQLLIYFH